MTRIEDVYCRPTTEDEWAEIQRASDQMPCTSPDIVRHHSDWSICGMVGSLNGRTEIPVPHFLDLVNDRIAPWRLKEVGFLTPFDAPIYRLLTPNHIIHVETRAESGGPFNPNDIVRVDGGETSITTFTDLLTLIKFLTPPTK